MQVLGIDIGGSGIKAAPVDTEKGELLAERRRIETPNPVTPKAVAKIVAKLTRHFDWQGPVGCGFPAVVRSGIARSAANIDESWLGVDVPKLFSKTTGCRVTVLNDADAAGLAEMRFGAGKGRKDLVLMVTIGTGLGTALFAEGCLVPNSELGHIILNGKDAELYASDATRKRKDLSWQDWGKRFNRYLRGLETLVWPDLIILGGGASKKLDRFAKCISVEAEVVPAKLLNNAGMIGAAMRATEQFC